MNNLILSKRPYLTVGQKVLYKVICERLKSGKPILFNEAREMYIRYSCRVVENGIPYYFNGWWRNKKDEIVGRNEPMSEWQIKVAASHWLTNSIGNLVIKGYLKVMPAIDFRELEK